MAGKKSRPGSGASKANETGHHARTASDSGPQIMKTRGELLEEDGDDKWATGDEEEMIRSGSIAEAILGLLLWLFLLPWRSLKRMNKIWELHTGLGMMEPWEAVVFDLVVFVGLTAISLAIYTYLPDHLRYMLKRTIYYASGTMVGDSTPTV